MPAGRSAATVRRPAGRCPSGWSAESGRGPGGAAYLKLIGSLFADPEADPAAATVAAFTGAAETLRELDFTDPCPIATVALEVASTHEALRRATADVFASWIEALAGFYAGAGIEAETARDTAGSVIALLEGAIMLGRAAHDTAPLLAAARASAAIVRDALGRAG
ncbi:LmrA/YxaF family transcription factor [Streptomyces sp. NBC_01243]|uniref:LmrA/YxaF family transcription factor n=1 Tax=Streptomyces sp. NBC_01243 TaxID=2903796 RepID=UPI003DA2B0D4